MKTMISPAEALRIVLAHIEPRPPDRVSLAAACGLQLAEEVSADREYPPFDRAMMDGYAVRLADAGRAVACAGEIAAGQPSSLSLTDGRCVEIMTGAACPPGTEAVVPKEDVRREGDRVWLPAPLARGAKIAPRGSDCPAGTVALQPGDMITPLGVAVMASFGISSVAVRARPSLAIITTGAELVPAGQAPAPQQIRDSNGPMLAAMAVQIGLDRPLVLHADDTIESIGRALDVACDHELLLLTGGVSAGNYDLVPRVLEDRGAEIIFHKVTQKPGKPLLFARRKRQWVFGLPGNPLASHLCFSRYVAAAARKMAGRAPTPRAFEGVLAAPVEYDGGRTYFCPARATCDGRDGNRWQVSPLPARNSSDIFTPATANCYLTVPPRSSLAAGAVVRFDWMCGIAENAEVGGSPERE